MIKKFYLNQSKIPKGYEIYEPRLEVMGVNRADDSVNFVANLDEACLEFEKDPNNAFDKNAIKIIGLCGSARYFIGFVPKETSRLIIEGGFWGRVTPRLIKIFRGEDGFIEILFQVIGIAGDKFNYLQTHKQNGILFDFDKVKHQMRCENYEEAIMLLIKMVIQTEKQARNKNEGVIPGCYEYLAIIYRRQKKYLEEIEILERFEQQPKSPGVMPAKLLQRLEKARIMQGRIIKD